ncbi:MAG: phosphatase PAP2-related protein [Ignavibacteriaceae bacterium]|nr:phosphatase PAP2-related protein [Ignavibacteriaceae bacterium]
MHDINKKAKFFKAWKIFLIRKHNRKELFYTVILLALLIFSFTRFLNYIELRAGFSFSDPLLILFKPIQLTWIIFGLIYIGIIIALINFIKDPLQLLATFQAILILGLFRTMAMYLLPLNPPSDMIPLNDPIVQMLGPGEILTKDLFFSGHTSTLFLLFLVADKKVLKVIFLVFAVVVGISVLLQHVHYSIDVFSAPFFAYASVKFATYIKKRYLLKY